MSTTTTDTCQIEKVSAKGEAAQLAEAVFVDAKFTSKLWHGRKRLRAESPAPLVDYLDLNSHSASPIGQEAQCVAAASSGRVVRLPDE